MLLAELHSMFSLVIVRIQHYIQQCSSIAHVHRLLNRAIEFLARLTRHFRNSRAQEDEEKTLEMTYNVHSLPPGGGYICASQLPRRSLTLDTRPSEPCSPSDTPYDAPARLVIPQVPLPTRKQTSQELMSSPEHLSVPAPPEMREALPTRTPNPSSPTAATRPPISVDTRSANAKRFMLGGYPDLSPSRTPVSPQDDYFTRPPLNRAATFGGSSDDPLSNTRSFLSPRRHTLAVPSSPDHETISRPGSVHSNVTFSRNPSNVSLGRNSYRKHDGQVPRPRSPTPSIYEGSNMGVISSTALTAVLAPSETDGSQVPFAPRPSSSDHTTSRETTGPRFAPMSANGVKRFDRHSRGFAMMYVFYVADIA
jgi:hypothetical protein